MREKKGAGQQQRRNWRKRRAVSLPGRWQNKSGIQVGRFTGEDDRARGQCCDEMAMRQHGTGMSPGFTDNPTEQHHIGSQTTQPAWACPGRPSISNSTQLQNASLSACGVLGFFNQGLHSVFPQLCTRHCRRKLPSTRLCTTPSPYPGHLHITANSEGGQCRVARQEPPSMRALPADVEHRTARVVCDESQHMIPHVVLIVSE